MRGIVDHMRDPALIIQLGPVEITCSETGDGEAILFIHGSWDDHKSWKGVIDCLGSTYRKVSYDRRGHSGSTAPAGQGHLSEDVNDALALIQYLKMTPAHVVGHSYGANVAIALAYTYPDRVRSLFVHEPPVFSLLNDTASSKLLKQQAGDLMQAAADLLVSGEVESGAKLFIEKVAFGEGSWRNLFDQQARNTILGNSDTWLDQFRDPERLAIDVSRLRAYSGMITLSAGTDSLPAYTAVIRRIENELPMAKTARIEGGGHGAHISHPRLFAKAILRHLGEIQA